jgi:uracil-DNA glycosylase
MATGRRFDALLREVRKCRICPLPHGARPVLQADPKARILIAGQAPGRRVHESGVPFQDPSGDRLRAWMGITSEVFYDASKVAILPMGFCYPGAGRSGDLPPRPECAPAWREQLLAALPRVELTLVIGTYAQAYHLGEAQQEDLTSTVRAWRDHWPEQLPLPHPSPRNNPWLRKNPWFEEDVLPTLRRRIKKLLK